MREKSQDAIREYRLYFDASPIMGGGPSLEEYTEQTPLTVGTPDLVIEKTLKFRDYFGDYQRQLFNVDGGGLPLKTVLEQIDLLGEKVVPVLREEFAKNRPANVPDAPTHATLVAAARGSAAHETAQEETAHEKWEWAQARFEARDYAKAAQLLATVVEDLPELTAPRLLLARSYYHSAQLKRAEEQLRLVIERDPVEHYAHLMLGRTLERQGRHDEAAPWLRMAEAFAGAFPEDD